MCATFGHALRMPARTWGTGRWSPCLCRLTLPRMCSVLKLLLQCQLSSCHAYTHTITHISL